MKNQTVTHPIYKVICKGCNKVLTRDEAIAGKVIKLNNVLYHMNCCKCTGCNIVIGVRPAYLSPLADGFVCAECNLIAKAPKCHGCSKSTFERCVMAFDVHWHQSCFKCRRCALPVKRMEYVVHKGFAYDEDCYYEEVLGVQEEPSAKEQ